MRFTNLLFTTGILLGMLILPSCLDDDDDVNRLYPNALVTVKEAADETVFFSVGRQYHPVACEYNVTPLRFKRGQGSGKLR